MASGDDTSDVREKIDGPLVQSMDVDNQECFGAGVSVPEKSATEKAQTSVDPSASSSDADTMQAAKLASDSIRTNLLSRVANSDGLFKQQQRDEPDLTFGEKYAIASDVLQNNPSKFLTRYGKFLQCEDLVYFTPLQKDYVIDFQVKEIKQMLDINKSQTKVRNRRYEAMKKLMEEGEYFGDEEMKSRDPLLYEQMWGQYLTEEELQPQIDKSDLRFSTILMSHIDMIQNNEMYKMQTEKEESQMEEGESDEEEEEEEEGEPSERISAIEKQMLRNELVKTMQQRFLNGEDKDFDYSKVDNNVEYDSLDIREHDEEEKYFDDEDEESIHSDNGMSIQQKNNDVIEDYESYEPNGT